MDEMMPWQTMLVMIWSALLLMTLVFIGRAWARILCFGKLLSEDCLVLGVLVVYIPVPVVWQLYLQSLFNIAHAADGTYIPGLTFLQDSEHALWALGASSILVIIGLWLIKTNFLVLFHRLGSNIPKYLWAWWACSFLVMACGIVALGLNEYECMFGRAQDIVQRCMTLEKRARMFYQGVAAAVLDAFSDLLLIIFPSWVLWNTRFSIRQKIVFSAVFALVGLTISMAVIRGSTSRSNIDDPKVARKQVNIAWIFWFAVEYLTSFVAACAISFRSLFVQHRNKLSLAREAQRPTPRSSSTKRGKLYQYFNGIRDTLVTTARNLEGTGYDHESWKLPMPASGLMTVDFSNEEGWRPVGESPEGSLKSLKPAHTRHTLRWQDGTFVSTV